MFHCKANQEPKISSALWQLLENTKSNKRIYNI